MLTTIRQLALVLPVFGAGSWAAWNGAQFALNPVLRYRAESAWFIFAAVLLAAGALATWRAAPKPSPVVAELPLHRPWWIGPALVLASVVLYAPVLGIGLLSDDFVLLDRVRSSSIADRSWEYIRPVPLALWWVIDALLPAQLVPAALHAVNAVLHGINAWLVFRVAPRLGAGERAGLLAACLFVATPLGVEPVAWASGVFDIMLTTCILSAALVALSDRLTRAPTIVLITALAAAALASKETAVVLPLLVAALLPFVPGARRRTVGIAAGVSAVLVAAYVIGRFALGTASPPNPSSGYAIKEMLSRPFGALGFGLHRRILEAMPAIGSWLAVAWPVLLLGASRRWARETRVFHLLLLGAAWVLLSVLPLMAMLFVSAELEGSRYLYLGSSIWSIAVAALIATAVPRSSRAWSTAVPIVAVLASAGAVLAHQRPWVMAGEVRDLVMSGLPAVPADCVPTGVAGLPDSVEGAFVFRNGGMQAVARPRAVGMVPCELAWDGSKFQVR